MNWVMVAGHLGADAEERFTAGGKKVISFRIAGNVRRGGKDETIWWRITIWGDRFDKMVPYLKKGSGVIVSGEMNKPEIYTDRNGVQQISLDVTAESIKFSPFGRGDKAGGGERSEGQEFGGGGSAGRSSFGGGQHSGGGQQSGGGQHQYSGVGANDGGGDDEIPF
jgi:single-strand DNA-binding protein